jgi:hypothetical protein
MMTRSAISDQAALKPGPTNWSLVVGPGFSRA